MAPQIGPFEDNIDRAGEITWDSVRLGIVEITILRLEMRVGEEWWVVGAGGEGRAGAGGGGDIAPGTWEVKEEYQQAM